MLKISTIVAVCVLVPSLLTPHIGMAANQEAQVSDTAAHEHLTEVACVDVPVGETRPEFGCFNVGTVTGLHFSQPTVYWHLRAYESREAADAAKSRNGLQWRRTGVCGSRNLGPGTLLGTGAKQSQ